MHFSIVCPWCSSRSCMSGLHNCCMISFSHLCSDSFLYFLPASPGHAGSRDYLTVWRVCGVSSTGADVLEETTAHSMQQHMLV